MEENTGILKNYFWRVAAVLLVNAVASIVISVVIRAPIDLPDVFFTTLFWTLYAPLFGAPLFFFSIWWILDRRIPVFVLVLIYAAFAGSFFFYSGPPQTSEEERTAINEMMGEGFIEGVEEDNRRLLEERKESGTEPVVE